MMGKKRKGKRLVFMTVAMCISIFAFTYVQADSLDINGHWAEGHIAKWINNGVVAGYADGTFKPQETISRAEFIVLIDKIFNFKEKSSERFVDVSGDAWYSDAVLRAHAAGIIQGDANGNFNGAASISRQEAAAMLARAFQLEGEKAQGSNSFSDASQIADWSEASVNILVEKGYINGRPDNTFAPRANITRAEAITLLDNIAGNLNNQPGIYDKNISGNLVVNTGGVTLKGMTIAGDLYVAQGVAEDELFLDGVTVKGNTYVLGGGENSITLKDTKIGGTLVVAKNNGKLTITATGSSDIAVTRVLSGVTLKNDGVNGQGFTKVDVSDVGQGHMVAFEGDFSHIVATSSDVNIRVANGKIGKLEISDKAGSVAVNLEASTTVKELVANGAVNIAGKGTIEVANINAQGVKLEQKPVKVVLADNIQVAIADITQPQTGRSGGGGGGGSSSGGGSPSDGGGNSGGGNQNGGSETPEEKPFVESVRISYAGPVRYLSIAFVAGTGSGYTYAIDGNDVSAEITPVTTEGRIVKYEMKRTDKTFTITQTATGKTQTFHLQ